MLTSIEKMIQGEKKQHRFKASKNQLQGNSKFCYRQGKVNLVALKCVQFKEKNQNHLYLQLKIYCKTQKRAYLLRKSKEYRSVRNQRKLSDKMKFDFILEMLRQTQNNCNLSRLQFKAQIKKKLNTIQCQLLNLTKSLHFPKGTRMLKNNIAYHYSPANR